jgi:hypothetical protein
VIIKRSFVDRAKKRASALFSGARPISSELVAPLATASELTVVPGDAKNQPRARIFDEFQP